MPTGPLPTETLRIGLLLCDHLDPDAAAVAGDYTVLFPSLFEPFGIEFEVFDLTEGRFPASVRDFPGWVTTGSRRSAYDDHAFVPDLLDLSRDLAAAELPHAGVCFGHQIIARALGGKVERADVGWGVGAREFDIVDRAPWMSPVEDGEDGSGPETVNPESVRLLMSHRDQVTDLPADAELVATSDYCPNGAYRIGSHVFTVQGHPEFVPELSAHLMRKRHEALGDEVVGAGLDSLEHPLDSAAVGHWFSRFLRR